MRAINRRQSIERFEGNCAACGKWGHKAKHCHQLAMYVYLTNFVNSGKNDDARKEALENWREKNKKWLDRDNRGRNRRDGRDNGGRNRRDGRRPRDRTRQRQDPKEVAKLYCRRLAMGVDDMADQLDWEFFAECSRDSDLGYVRYASDCEGSGSDEE